MNISSSGRQGWQGRGESLSSAPRPATPGEISYQRPATPSDAGLQALPRHIVWPGHTRPGLDICQDLDFKMIF